MYNLTHTKYTKTVSMISNGGFNESICPGISRILEGLFSIRNNLGNLSKTLVRIIPAEELMSYSLFLTITYNDLTYFGFPF